jgi:hypothetical protein
MRGNKWNETLEKRNQLYRVKILKFVPFVPFLFHLVPPRSTKKEGQKPLGLFVILCESFELRQHQTLAPLRRLPFTLIAEVVIAALVAGRVPRLARFA